MANIFEQYGIKEVADVTLYDIETGNPVLFLDTLKVSTIEQTAEQAEARGGKGNSPLIIWDYGKEITVTLEDALFSPASMAIMFGSTDIKGNVEIATEATVSKVEKVILTTDITSYSALTTAITEPKEVKAGQYTGALQYFIPSGGGMVQATSGTTGISLAKDDVVYIQYNVKTKEGGVRKMVIDAEHFPGTYKLVGDTYARNRKTGKDDYFQFIINQAKMSAEQTLTLEAEGDPTVFNMTMRVLRPDNGEMMELIQYVLEDASGN